MESENSGENSTTNNKTNEQHILEIDVPPENTINEEECWKCAKYFNKTRLKFREDIIYQDKVVYSACILGTCFILGWGKGQFGPAFLDLRIISNTNLEQGSWILTSLFIGYSIGSLLQGFLYEKVNQKLMYSACLFIWSIILAGIPWCSVFEAMLCSFIIVGLLQGILDTGGNTEILRVWEKKGRVAILRMNLIFALGSVMAPLVVAPFLMDQTNDRQSFNFTLHGSKLREHTFNITNSLSNQHISMENNQVDNRRSFSYRHSNMLVANYSHTTNDGNLSHYRFNSSFKFKSDIYIPFSLCAALSCIASIMFFMSYVLYSNEMIPKTFKRNVPKRVRKVPTTLITFSLSVIAAIIFFYTGMEGTYTSFLTTYCVEQFHWTKQDGAFLTSLVFISILIARLLTVIFEKWIDTLVLIGISFVLILFSILGLLLVSLYNFDAAVWLFSPLFGFSKSSLFALLFTWSNEYITPMTGQISAYYFVISTLGCALNPILLGMLMENDPIWYCYLFLIEIVIILVLYICGFLITKCIVRKYGKTYDATQDVVQIEQAEIDKFIE